MKGINAIFDTPSTIGKSIGGRPTEHRRRSPDVPWWLVAIPAALVTLIMLVISLTLLMAPWPSEPFDPEDDGEVPLLVVDEIDRPQMTMTPAFSR